MSVTVAFVAAVPPAVAYLLAGQAGLIGASLAILAVAGLMYQHRLWRRR